MKTIEHRCQPPTETRRNFGRGETKQLLFPDITANSSLPLTYGKPSHETCKVYNEELPICCPKRNCATISQTSSVQEQIHYLLNCIIVSPIEIKILNNSQFLSLLSLSPSQNHLFYEHIFWILMRYSCRIYRNADNMTKKYNNFITFVSSVYNLQLTNKATVYCNQVCLLVSLFNYARCV